MYVAISTDNQIKSDAAANRRLEQKIRAKLRRFERRLTHVEVHVSDANAGKGGNDKHASLELRANGHAPLAVHADAHRVEDAVATATDKAARALSHALGKLGDSKGH